MKIRFLVEYRGWHRKNLTDHLHILQIRVYFLQVKFFLNPLRKSFPWFESYYSALVFWEWVKR